MARLRPPTTPVALVQLETTAEKASTSSSKAAQRREQRNKQRNNVSDSDADVSTPMAVTTKPTRSTSSKRAMTYPSLSRKSPESSSGFSSNSDSRQVSPAGLSSTPSSALISRNASRLGDGLPDAVNYNPHRCNSNCVETATAALTRRRSIASAIANRNSTALPSPRRMKSASPVPAGSTLAATTTTPFSPTANRNLNMVPRLEGEARRLYNYNEIPSHLQDNEFIMNYYRAHLTSSECAQSVFEIHNETGNIWSHLLGMLVYALIWYWVQVDVIVPRHDGGEWIHRIQFTILIASMMFCLGASAYFHTMLAHADVAVFKFAHAIDYAGATCLIMGTFIPITYYSFVCLPSLQIGYMIMACVMGITGVIAPMIPWFEDEDKFFARMGIYAAIGASATVPLIHMCFATPLNHMTIPIYAGILTTFLISVVAAVIYGTHFPECFAPGRFDLWFSSHQIWHILIFLGGIVQFFNGAALYQNWSIMQGRC